MNLVDELHAVAAALEGAGIRYAVCGGLAVTIHGAVRTTQDIDLLVAPADVERVFAAISPLGFAFRALEVVFEAGTPRERSVHQATKIVGTDHLLVDVIVAGSSFADMLDDRVAIALPGGPLAVVSRDALSG